MSAPCEESLEAVFWRLLSEGVPVAAMAQHPDYRAAFDREYPDGWPYLTDRQHGPEEP